MLLSAAVTSMAGLSLRERRSSEEVWVLGGQIHEDYRTLEQCRREDATAISTRWQVVIKRTLGNQVIKSFVVVAG